MVWDISKCKLCGRTENEEVKSDHLRTVYIGSNNKLWKGFFRPRLTIDEFYLLEEYENTICSNRKQCQKRRRRKTK